LFVLKQHHFQQKRKCHYSSDEKKLFVSLMLCFVSLLAVQRYCSVLYVTANSMEQNVTVDQLVTNFSSSYRTQRLVAGACADARGLNWRRVVSSGGLWH
jgi:hypothetical protein